MNKADSAELMESPYLAAFAKADERSADLTPANLQKLADIHQLLG